MTIEQCNHCIKKNQQRNYCAYYKKSIANVISCERVIEFKMPQCSKHNCPMDMQNITKNTIEYKCLFCDEKTTVSLSKEYKDKFND